MKLLTALITIFTFCQSSYAAQIVCITTGSGLTGGTGGGQVQLTIDSSSFLNAPSKMTITADGMFTNTYEVEINEVRVGTDQVEIKGTSDITSFILSNFSFGPEEPVTIPAQRVIDVAMTLKTAGVAGIVALGDGQLNLSGDLSGTRPSLRPTYTLNSCTGQLQ